MSSALDRLRALRGLHGRRERRLLLRVLMIAPWVRPLMRLPLPTVSRILETGAGTGPGLGDDERVAAVVETAQRIASPLVARGCLTRGITLFWLLGAEYDLRLCFGLGAPAGSISGHCWLERDGEPFLERLDPRGRFPEQYAIESRHHGTR